MQKQNTFSGVILDGKKQRTAHIDFPITLQKLSCLTYDPVKAILAQKSSSK